MREFGDVPSVFDFPVSTEARSILEFFFNALALGRPIAAPPGVPADRRVNIARAVDPDILLMDEPFVALDAQTREIMQAEMTRIWQETKKTVVLITHQIDEAVFLSDRVFVFTARPGRSRKISLWTCRARATSRSNAPSNS